MNRFAPAAVALFLSLSLFAQDVPLKNWAVPSSGKVSTHGDVNGGSVFVAVTPCRVVDTRLATGAFGGPAFTAGTVRHYVIKNGPCTGIPEAASYSLNVTALSYSSSGHVTVYPLGSTPPPVATVNFGSGWTVSNAVVSGALSGAVSVYASASTHILLDVNGYFHDGSDPMNPNKNLVVDATINDSGAVVGVNRAFTTTAYGVMGMLYSTGATNNSAGVYGYVPQGVSHGVVGVTDSAYDNATGVWGYTWDPVTTVATKTAGVRGDSDLGFGVVGYSSASRHGGVIGAMVDSTGTVGNYGVLGTSSYGVLSVGNFGATGTKTFVDPHPTDASKVIRYVALEGPEAGTYFRGRGTFRGGKAVIEVPESFRLTSEPEGLTVHVTPVGGFAQVAVMQESLDGIVVQATRDVDFTYIVHGVRRGYADFEAIGPGDEFRPRDAADTLPSHLNAEQKKRLIENGTYHADGSVNLETAAARGWIEAWQARPKERAQKQK
ncbi:MAG TPA: hypothetical protein VF883_24880 [Thermoanaerobaculia bacterium]|jgi:hypothetical protein